MTQDLLEKAGQAVAELEALERGEQPPLYAWKFLIPSHEWVQHPTEAALSWKGCLAVVLAPTEEAARERLVAYAGEQGFDPRWLDCVKSAKRLNVVAGAVFAWVEL